MAGFLLHQGAVVICAHGGQAMPTTPNPRVLVTGMPTATIAAPWVVAGCPLVPPPIPPCVTGLWLIGTVRVTSMGQPLVVQTGTAITMPGAATLIPISMQTRVMAT
ncbi:hypothetical protein [Edaphobacter aggregans]|uniref:hypothetical protein n=1 Tax=Edaphobacter aggregans TaxID=570835 RepID=UPI000558B700|nr:hypothetical protein [Edaphobacter aggregans]